jgi:hypothetical protein
MNDTSGLPIKLVEALEADHWTLDYASWLLAGFHHDQNNPMILERVAVEMKVHFGTPDYDYAQKKHDEIFKIIMQSKNMTSMQLVRRGITEGETKWKKATFDKDWIINLVVNDLHEDQSVSIPWLRLAHNAGLIADWILNPNIVDSGKIEMESTAEAHIESSVVRNSDYDHTKFEMKKLKNELGPFRYWVYQRMLALSLGGAKKPTVKSLIENEFKDCMMYISNIPSEKKIVYREDSSEGNQEWSYDAIKQFISHHTIVIKR